jgi:hypothetical protein
MFQMTQGVKVSPNTVILSGRRAITGANTATPLSSSSTPCLGVWVSGDIAAGQPMSVGDANVAAGAGSWRGVIVVPGNDPVFLPCDDLNRVYFNSESASAVACFTYFAS